MTSVTLQPLRIDYANILHMEAMYVPFHMGYGELIWSKRLPSDRPKCKGMLVDPRAFQSHAEIRFFVPSLNYTYLSEKLKFFVS